MSSEHLQHDSRKRRQYIVFSILTFKICTMKRINFSKTENNRCTDQKLSTAQIEPVTKTTTIWFFKKGEKTDSPGFFKFSRDGEPKKRFSVEEKVLPDTLIIGPSFGSLSPKFSFYVAKVQPKCCKKCKVPNSDVVQSAEDLNHAYKTTLALIHPDQPLNVIWIELGSPSVHSAWRQARKIKYGLRKSQVDYAFVGYWKNFHSNMDKRWLLRFCDR